MNVLIKTVGGGTFSKFMVAIDALIRQIDDLDSIDKIHIDIDRDRIDLVRQKKLHLNPFDYVLQQDNVLIFDEIVNASPLDCYTNLFENVNYEKLSKVCSKLILKDIIVSRVNGDIDENTLGVHVRLTDMDIIHSVYGVSSTKEYIERIRLIMDNNPNLTKIFVASDNKKSIDLIGDEFDIIYNTVGNRCVDERGDGYVEYLRNQSGEENLWVDSFLEMYSLSKCGELLHKMSNLNNASILFSNTIKKMHRIHKI